MIPVSGAFKRAIYDNSANFDIRVEITLVDGTELSLTNTELYGNGISIEDAIGNDTSFNALGGVVINSATIYSR